MNSDELIEERKKTLTEAIATHIFVSGVEPYWKARARAFDMVTSDPDEADHLFERITKGKGK